MELAHPTPLFLPDLRVILQRLSLSTFVLTAQIPHGEICVDYIELQRQACKSCGTVWQL
jgi:hypothetical protein